MRKLKHIVSLLLAAIMMSMSILSVGAEENIGVQDISDTELFSQVQVYTTAEDIDSILRDKPELEEYNNKLLQKGYILENIVVKTYNGNTSTYGLNSDTSDEIVIMDHRQPARSKKVFAEDIYNTIAYINNPVMVTLGFIDYVWIPFTLFGITTEMVGTSLSEEWYQVSDNNTLHTKVAYIYDAERDDKYWGAEASCMHVSGTVIEVVYNDNNDAYQCSESFNMDLKSPN